MLSSGTQASVSARNLTKQFGQRLSVDNLNLNIYPGELYALLGDNGAGKTTTISMLTTLLPPSSGEFFICGFNGLSQAEKIKGCFGVVSQDLAVYNELTPYENLKFLSDLYGLPKKLSEERIEKLLRRAGLVDRLNDRTENLSGGMMRRLAIACAMINEPKVLFMDEPTVGLDPAARRLIWATLKELKSAGVTILLTTHYLEEAELLADRIGIIRSGRLTIEGTVPELAKRIRGMRGISIRLMQECSVDSPAVASALVLLKSKFALEVRLDSLRNTIYLTQLADDDVEHYHKEVFAWLYQENIPFLRFATGEPNLEEVFLAVSKDEEAKERILNSIHNARNKNSLIREIDHLKQEIGEKYEFEKSIIGSSPAIKKIFGLMEKAAKTNIITSITGETGTGKELIARAIHYNSKRKNEPFVAVNIAAIPKDLIESELFGHEKGAFTSAVATRKGKFELAEGGTIFLDEIGDMSLSAQAKVLRALQENKITRVGGDKEIKVDVRIIAATNKDLKKEIEKGEFREDLFHRLSVIPIQVPSLNDRKEDIPALAEHFINLICTDYGMPIKTISKDALKALQQKDWTGNIREFRNVIERLIILCGKEITDKDVKQFA